VGSKDAPLFVKSFGTLVANMTIDIIPQVTEVLRQIHVNSGDPVEVNQLMYTIDQRQFKANVEKARATLLTNEAQAQVAKDKMRRNLELVKTNLISPQDFETLVAEAEEAEQAVYSARAELELAELDLSYTQIRSPIKGVCGLILVDAGNLVLQGQTLLMTVNQVDPILCNFYLPTKDFPAVQKALRENNNQIGVRIAPADDTTQSVYYDGVVNVMDNQIDPNTGTIHLQGSIPNPDYALWPGQFIYGWIKLKELHDVSIVEQSAIAIGDKGPYAYVVKSDNTVELRELVVGETFKEKIMVMSGLKPGETVVTRGQMNLQPGAKVQVVASNDPSGATTKTELQEDTASKKSSSKPKKSS
tara:strand:- start:1931 stop:3007 length:1077 start_codon:yes stop_codon:yes gene_type:complete